MKLCSRIRKRLKSFTVDISFTCDVGRLLAVIGPTGAGKTTILRSIAGLEQPDTGCIVFNDTVWFDSSRRVNLPPQKRKVGYVSQGYSLFPHMTVKKNIGFAAGRPEIIGELMDLFHIGHLADARPHEISGGERQRAAFAQALAAEPHMLLLDEPFSSLDYKTRLKMRDELMNLKKRFAMPIIMVTHDLEEAACLADTVLPVAGGVLAPDWLPATMPARLAMPFENKKEVLCNPIETSLTGRTSTPAGCAI